MRRAFLEGCKTERQARKLAHWAVMVVKVDGGYMAFESVLDRYLWSGQR